VRARLLAPAAVGALTCAYVVGFPLAIGRADESHYLFEARRVFDGEVPYRDFFESLTPLSLYLLAAVYALFGVSLRAARIAIACVDALAAGLLWHNARRVAGAWEASLVTALFVCLCLPVWLYASPHWISTALALAAAAAVLGAQPPGWTWRAALAGVFAGAAIGVQQQRGVFLALWLPVAWLILAAELPRAQRWRATLRATLASVAGAVLIVGAVLGYAVWRASLAGMVDMVFGFAVNNYGPSNSGRVAWAEVLLLTNPYAKATWLWVLRVAPVLVAIEAVLALRAVRRDNDWRERQRLALCALALLMGLSIAYLPDFLHVSFVMPMLLMPIASLLDRLREALQGWRPPVALAARAALALAIGAVVWKGATNLGAAHRAAPTRFETAFGPIDATPPVARLYDAVVQHQVRDPDGQSWLYSYPNDAWLYLATATRNPTPFSSLIPNMFSPRHFEQALAALRARRAGLVMIWLPMLSNPDTDGDFPPVLAEGYDEIGDIEGYRFYRRRDAPAGGGA
jgi:hypothetical protein